MDDVPSVWVTILLLGASYRIWRLLAEDEILDRPRRWLVKLPRDWEESEPIPADYRESTATFINCVYCFGFWIVLVIWGFWQVEPHWTTVLAVPFAISAGVAVWRVRLDPE